MMNLTIIKNKFDEIISGKVDGIAAIDRSKLHNSGAIYYRNGNDGTDFDFRCNEMTCEFYVYLANGDGYIKCNQRRNKFVFYVYNPESPFDGTYHEIIIDSPFELEEICAHLMAEFDDNNKYDEMITNWVLNDTNYSIIPDEDMGGW